MSGDQCLAESLSTILEMKSEFTGPNQILDFIFIYMYIL